MNRNLEELFQLFGDSPYRTFTVTSGEKELTLRRRNASKKAAAPRLTASEGNIPVVVMDKIVAGRVGNFTPAVSVGDEIQKGDVVGHIKAMNIMHEQISPVAGKIKEILASEGSGVAYGDELMELE